MPCLFVQVYFIFAPFSSSDLAIMNYFTSEQLHMIYILHRIFMLNACHFLSFLNRSLFFLHPYITLCFPQGSTVPNILSLLIYLFLLENINSTRRKTVWSSTAGSHFCHHLGTFCFFFVGTWSCPEYLPLLVVYSDFNWLFPLCPVTEILHKPTYCQNWNVYEDFGATKHGESKNTARSQEELKGGH